MEDSVSITASMVAELRAKTGAGMMDCKKALVETGGNIEQAVDFLRKKGLSAAAKKADRVAAEGLIVAKGNDGVEVIVEVNAETDFVAKNTGFQEFTDGIAAAIVEHNPADIEALAGVAFPGTNCTVSEELTKQIATIGENMNIRRFARIAPEQGSVCSYVHGGGKIGVLVELVTVSTDQKVADTARQIAMHIAAANPQYLNRDEVPSEVVEREKDIMRAKAKESGKPENIIEKILVGQINKFFGEICLLEQTFVIDPDLTINKVVAALAKDLGSEIALSQYVRYQLGEGLEKKEDNFAEEVASMTK